MTDWHYCSAKDLLKALDSGTVTSVELTQAMLDRIDGCNPSLNAVVSLAREDALAQAKAADDARQQGEKLGPLHGLPLTIKDVWEVEGMHCTAGAPSLREHIPSRNADTIQRLVDAGAIILGKTNVPFFASDTQTFNKIYGVTNNPWDTERTPGGSSGGAAAALAAGMTPLELGSDVGGSIRTPAHFTGTFGHKVSRDIVSMRGHIPGPPGTLSQPDLAVGGPMSRTAEDLSLLLEVITAPAVHEGPHWRISLPKPKLKSLKDARVAVRWTDPKSLVADDMMEGYRTLTRELETRGALVGEPEHHALDHETLLPLYYNMLGSLLGTGFKAKQRKQMQRIQWMLQRFGELINTTHGIDQYAAGVNQSYSDYARRYEQREKLRAAVAELFTEYDVLLTPTNTTTAIRHDHTMPMFRRQITVNGEKRPYMDLMNWIALATLLGLPATSAPIGRDRNGLPFNVQIIGGPGQDLTTIRFAQLLEEEGLSGFEVPPGY